MSAIKKLRWLRIKYGPRFHARIGTRSTFACGKKWEPRYNIADGAVRSLFNPRCNKCTAAIALLEDIYGGATD